MQKPRYFRLAPDSYFENRVFINRLKNDLSYHKHKFSQFDYALATYYNNNLKTIGINKRTRKIDTFNRAVNKCPFT